MENKTPALSVLAMNLRNAQANRLRLYKAQDLDAMALEGKTILVDQVAWSEEMKIPQLDGNWIARYVGTASIGMRGRIVLLPDDDLTREKYRKGQLLVAITAGLSPQRAEIWTNSKVPRKHDLLDRLVQVLADEKLIEAYASYKPDFDRDAYRDWMKKTGIQDNLTAKARGDLKKLIKEMQSASATKAMQDGTVTLDDAWALVNELADGNDIPFTYEDLKAEYHARLLDGRYLRREEIEAMMTVFNIAPQGTLTDEEALRKANAMPVPAEPLETKLKKPAVQAPAARAPVAPAPRKPAPQATPAAPADDSSRERRQRVEYTNIMEGGVFRDKKKNTWMKQADGRSIQICGDEPGRQRTFNTAQMMWLGSDKHGGMLFQHMIVGGQFKDKDNVVWVKQDDNSAVCASGDKISDGTVLAFDVQEIIFPIPPEAIQSVRYPENGAAATESEAAVGELAAPASDPDNMDEAEVVVAETEGASEQSDKGEEVPPVDGSASVEDLSVDEQLREVLARQEAAVEQTASAPAGEDEATELEDASVLTFGQIAIGQKFVDEAGVVWKKVNDTEAMLDPAGR